MKLKLLILPLKLDFLSNGSIQIFESFGPVKYHWEWDTVDAPKNLLTFKTPESGFNSFGNFFPPLQVDTDGIPENDSQGSLEELLQLAKTPPSGFPIGKYSFDENDRSGSITFYPDGMYLEDYSYEYDRDNYGSYTWIGIYFVDVPNSGKITLCKNKEANGMYGSGVRIERTIYEVDHLLNHKFKRESDLK